jgi:DnaK suppressor protein
MSDKGQVTVAIPAHISSRATIAPYKPKKGEAYMSENMKAHFRQVLESARRTIKEEVDLTLTTMRDPKDRSADVTDQATDEEQMALHLRERNREGKLLRKIEESLDKIDHDEYGYCEACGIEIGLGRLEARPTATLCIDCKTLDEIREKQRGG